MAQVTTRWRECGRCGKVFPQHDESSFFTRCEECSSFEEPFPAIYGTIAVIVFCCLVVGMAVLLLYGIYGIVDRGGQG
jgi:hypothetical protein